MVERYRVDILAGLARQMAFSPAGVREAQTRAAEAFVREIDPAKLYAWPDIVARITGYRPKNGPTESIAGLALRHDLCVLIEEVFGTLGRKTTDVAEPVLSIDDVVERFNVTSKTIQRWRKRGLVSRLFVFPDGRTRVGFLLSSVEAFIADNKDTVRRGANFSQVDAGERDLILRHARRLAGKCRCCSREIARRLGRRFGRSPLTILHTIRKHDQENPADSIFAIAPKEMSPTIERRVARLARRGVPLNVLAKKSRQPKSAVYRAIIAQRIARIEAAKVRFHDDPLFHGDNAYQQLVELVRAADAGIESPTNSDRILKGVDRIPKGLPPYLADLYRHPLLTPAQERALFLLFNYHRFRFVEARRRLEPELCRKRELDELESHLKAAASVKDRIVASNLRLVVSVARKHAPAGASFWGPPLTDLISEGNLILLRAVDSFDVGRNNKFSTYATMALMKGFARATGRRERVRPIESERLAAVADTSSLRQLDLAADAEQIDGLLNRLAADERYVIALQFGLGGEDRHNIAEISRRLNLSRHAVRRLEQSALAKLRAAAVE